MNIDMDFSKPLWEFDLLEDFSDDLSLVFGKMHHSFTDGIGFSSMMSLLNDEDKRFKMDKKFPEASWKTKLYRILMTPYFIISTLIKYHYLQSDPNTNKMNEINRTEKMRNKYFKSEFISFNEMQKCYKRFTKVTFNDYMLGLLGVSYDKWFRKYGIEGAHKLCTIIPVNMRPLPNNFSELKLGNYITSIKFELPIGENIKSNIDSVKQKLVSLLDQDFLKAMTNFFKIIPRLPEALNKKLFYEFYDRVNLMFSNVPLTSEAWYF